MVVTKIHLLSERTRVAIKDHLHNNHHLEALLPDLHLRALLPDPLLRDLQADLVDPILHQPQLTETAQQPVPTMTCKTQRTAQEP